jgi:hypothetical protein
MSVAKESKFSMFARVRRSVPLYANVDVVLGVVRACAMETRATALACQKAREPVERLLSEKIEV